MASSKKAKVEKNSEPENKPERYKGLDMSRIFWGFSLVLVGLLVLLDNLGVVRVQYENLWQLWPLLIIAWGISLLNIKGTWWSIVATLLMIGSLGIITWAAVAEGPIRSEQTSVQTKQAEKSRDSTDRLEVLVNAGAGKIKVRSSETDIPVESVLRSDFATLNLTSRHDGSSQTVEVNADGSRMWWNGSTRNELDVMISKRLPINLNLQTGASQLDADMSDLIVEKLDVDVGANSSVITLGSRADNVIVQLDAGASSVTVRVPKSSGVSVTLDKGASSQQMEGLIEKGDGRYETDGLANASKKITISGDLGASSFKLQRY